MSVVLRAPSEHHGSEETIKGVLWKENWLTKDKRNGGKEKEITEELWYVE